MVPKRNMDPNEMKSTKPKRTRRSKKPCQFQPSSIDKTQLITQLYKACQFGNIKIVRQLLNLNGREDMKSNNSNQQINSKEIQENKLLQIASKNGNVEVVKELLKYELDIDDKNNDEKTALHLAAENGHASVVTELLAHGADVNLYDGCKNPDQCGKFCKNENALLMASKKGHTEVVKAILKSNSVNVDARDNNGLVGLGLTSLHNAVFHGNVEMVTELLAYGANGNLIFDYGIFNTTDSKTALHIAACNGYSDIVKELLKYNIDVDVRDRTGRTALHLASGRGYTSIVAQLLTYGANFKIFTEGQYIHKALHIAAHEGYRHCEVVKEILKYDKDIDSKDGDGNTPLHIASEFGYAKIAKVLLEHGANAKILTEDKEKALNIATNTGYLEVVKEILKYDQEVDFKDESGKTPLHIASEKGYLEIVKELLDHGAKADIHVGDKPEGCNGVNCDMDCYPEGNTLYLAAHEGHIEIVKLLLTHGASLSKKCAPNVLDLVCQIGNLEILKELIKSGANINEPALLHMAVSRGKLELIKELLRQGADVNHENSYFGTPINVAAQKGNLPIVKELLNHGANPFHQLDEDCDSEHRIEDTPFFAALYKEHESIIDEMLLHGEIDSIVDENGYTKLHHASLMGNSRAVSKLLARGSNPNVLSKTLETPLHYSIEGACLGDGSDDMVKELLNHGADINIQDELGETAFHKVFARYHFVNNNYNIIHLLMDERYNYNFALENKNGKTVLDIAIEQKNLDVAKIIAKRMCPTPKITDSVYPLKHFK